MLSEMIYVLLLLFLLSFDVCVPKIDQINPIVPVVPDVVPSMDFWFQRIFHLQKDLKGSVRRCECYWFLCTITQDLCMEKTEKIDVSVPIGKVGQSKSKSPRRDEIPKNVGELSELSTNKTKNLKKSKGLLPLSHNSTPMSFSWYSGFFQKPIEKWCQNKDFSQLLVIYEVIQWRSVPDRSLVWFTPKEKCLRWISQFWSLYVPSYDEKVIDRKVCQKIIFMSRFVDLVRIYSSIQSEVELDHKFIYGVDFVLEKILKSSIFVSPQYMDDDVKNSRRQVKKDAIISISAKKLFIIDGITIIQPLCEPYNPLGPVSGVWCVEMVPQAEVAKIAPSDLEIGIFIFSYAKGEKRSVVYITLTCE